MSSKQQIFSKPLSYVDLPAPTFITANFSYVKYSPDESAAEQQLSASARGASLRNVVISWEPVVGSSDHEDAVDLKKLMNNVKLIHREGDIAHTAASTFSIQDDAKLRVRSTIKRSAQLRGIVGNDTDIALKLSSALSGAVDPSTLQVTLSERRSAGVMVHAPRRQAAGSLVRGVAISFIVSDHFVGDVVKSGASSNSAGPLQSMPTGNVFTLWQSAIRRKRPAASSVDFESVIVPTSYFETAVKSSTIRNLLGYVVERSEASTGSSEIVGVTSRSAVSFIDHRVKYGSRYVYAVRAIYEVEVPSLLVGRGEQVIAKVLIASRASNLVAIDCLESYPPKPPADVEFVWDGQRQQLIIFWTFPKNSTQDVTRFQVFRRRSLTEPFMLMKELDFDETLLPMPRSESVLPVNVRRTTYPQLSFVDPDFGQRSRYIYALGCVDAHGFVSGYSTQYEVSFDQFRGNIRIDVVSRESAPRSYPNLYVGNGKKFTHDTIVRSGMKKMDLVFDPEYLRVTDANGADMKILRTLAEGAEYVLMMIDTDRAEQAALRVQVDDLRSVKAG